MVTKGIIKSIDLLGNTCTVHIPFFETAGNDPIIETATVSNTPGSYNGYKVGDAVYVAFEDGNMSTPVIIGKLYLGTEKEKADPRGVSNVEESTAAKKATLPADSKLTAEIDSNVPNTTVPYSSLSSIANGLNTLNTNVGQMDRDYGNRFKQVISDIEGNKSTLEQTSKSVLAKVSGYKTDENGDPILTEPTEFGWNLQKDSWIVFNKDKAILEANELGLTVKGKIIAESGHLGKFIIGAEHPHKNNDGSTDPDLIESGIYTEDYIDCFKDQVPTEKVEDENGNEIEKYKSGVYLGTDGIKLGGNFSVDPDGSLIAKDGHIGKFNIGAEHECTELDSGEVASGIYSDNYIKSYEEEAGDKKGVYVGTDGIKLGEHFAVDTFGNVTATSLTISYKDINGNNQTATNIDNAVAEILDISKGYSDRARSEANKYTNEVEARANKHAEEAANDVKDDVYEKLDIKDTTITVNGIATPAVLADNLWVNSVKINGQLTASQINTTGLTADSIEVKNKTTKKIAFSANAASGNVEIGGFKVTSNKLFAGSGKDYVEFGTEAIKLGGDDSDDDNAAPFSVTKAGYLTAESGTIGGFEITKTCLKSSNNDLQLLSNGQIIAKSGEIGGFQLASNGFIKPDHLSITSESAFFEAASFSLNNDVVIYNDNTNKVDNAYTSYITTTGKRHFEIKNAGGAGIRFKADSANEAVTQNITFSYKRYNAPNTDPGSEYATVMDEFLDIEYKIDGSGTLISPSTFILYYRYSHGKTSWLGDDITTETKEISVTVPTGQNSGTCGTFRIFVTTDVWNYCVMHGISASNSTNNSDFSETVKIPTVDINTSNNILYSLGSFCPFTTATADSGYLLGNDSHVWRTIRAYTASITTSDRREKNNIKSLETRHEDFFDGLVPVTFIYEHADSGRTHLGFIAQDVEKALLTAGFSTSEFAGLCIGNDDNKTYGLRYEEFIALNTDQIQKLKKRVADQEARITELEEIIKKLKTK